MLQNEMIERFFSLVQLVNRYARAGQFNLENRDNLQITRVQWLILRHLHHRRENTIGQLAEHLNVRPSTMSQMIDRLEKVKLVYRATDATDARARMVRLTDDGEETIRRMESRFVAKLAAPFQHLTADEQQLLVQLLTKLTAGFPKRGE